VEVGLDHWSSKEIGIPTSARSIVILFAVTNRDVTVVDSTVLSW
jgi:hypothetical protein